jgi:mono/diheme cytochrome c family protein
MLKREMGMKKSKPLAPTILALAGAIAAALPVRADTAAVQKNYQTFCAKCHGDSGNGNGSAAATLSAKPRDFADCGAMQKISDDTLFNVIKNGGKANGLSADMQAWSDGFEDSEIHELVAYVRSFCKK